MKKPRYQWKNQPAVALENDVTLQQAWDKLNSQQAQQPFLSSHAVIAALNQLSQGEERLLIAHEEGQPVAMFVLTPAGSFQWRTFQPSQMPLGVWVAAKDSTLEDLARSLLHGPIGFCLALSITQIDPLIAPRQADTPDSSVMDYIDTAWIDLNSSFEDYWNARGKNLKQNMRKQRAKLELENIATRFEVLTKTKDMAQAVAQFGRLESMGWKEKMGTAIHPDNPQGRFYRDLLEKASLAGEALVCQYLLGPAVVAMNLCLLRQGNLVVLKTCYDESIKSYSPASLLREAELQLFFKEGLIKRIEYFGRMMDWHSKLTDQKRTLHHLTVYRWPMLKQISAYRQKKAIALGECA